MGLLTRHGWHGDILKTNVLRDTAGNLYIVDFSVANNYPRIQELAVLFCNVLFDEDRPTSFPDYYDLVLSEYQKYIPLTSEELSALPLLIQAAHAMHVIGATYQKIAKANNTAENEYWLNLGKVGLRYTSKLFPKQKSWASSQIKT